MPKGPQGQRRSADAVGCAVQVAKIATGEESEAVEPPQTTLWWLYEKVAPYFKRARGAIINVNHRLTRKGISIFYG